MVETDDIYWSSENEREREREREITRSREIDRERERERALRRLSIREFVLTLVHLGDETCTTYCVYCDVET